MQDGVGRCDRVGCGVGWVRLGRITSSYACLWMTSCQMMSLSSSRACTATARRAIMVMTVMSMSMRSCPDVEVEVAVYTALPRRRCIDCR